jgi:hypothetical protein
VSGREHIQHFQDLAQSGIVEIACILRKSSGFPWACCENNQQIQWLILGQMG